MESNIQIKCPKCGMQYLASEIFSPKHFLGYASDIIKNGRGEVISFEGADMDLKADTYYCEHCGQAFNVEATIKFKVSKAKNEDSDGFDPEF